MDEENEKQGKQQKTNQIKNMLSQEMKNRAKKELFKKLIIPVLPYLLIGLCILIGFLILYAGLANFLSEDKSEEGKQAAYSAVQNAESDSEEDITNKIILDNKDIEDGSYKIDYEFTDEDGTVLDNDQSLDKIKSDMLKDSPDLKIDDFSESELKILGALMYNGLDIEYYNFEELQAIALFVKVDLASQNFDLRKKDSEITLKDLKKGDEIYGILEIYKTSVGITDENSNESQKLKYEPQKLEYVPYKDFVAMKNSKNQEVLSKFTINKDGNLVYATMSSSVNEYTYSDKDGEISYEEMLEKSPNYALESKNETKIKASKPLDYKPLIEKYRVGYDFLFDLLTTTKNVDFCLELAQMSLNSKIVINIKEELVITEKESKAEITQTTLLYDYVDYNVSGVREKMEFILQQSGNPSNSPSLQAYGWNEGIGKDETGEDGGTLVYDWEYDNVKYQLKYSLTRNTWRLYKIVPDTDNELTLDEGQNELINLNGNHITEVYDDYTIDEDYTDKEEHTFTRETYIKTESRICKLEMLEIDCWYGTYKAEHEDPKIESKSQDLSDNDLSTKYPQEPIIIQEPTDDEEIINNDSHVKAFTEAVEQEEQSRAENVECDVSKLTIKQKTKTEGKDIVSKFTTTKYKYGEEVADNAELKMKNVELVGDIPTFTAEDEDGNPEIGFLYILDKYMQAGNDVFLTDDAEYSLFNKLEMPTETENETSSSQVSTIIRYLLYVYDGKDRGVTQLNSDILGIMDFKQPDISAKPIREWLKSYEFENLREYRNKDITYEQFKNGYRGAAASLDENGKLVYHMYKLNVNGDHSWNFSYGIRVWDIPHNKLSLDEHRFTDVGITVQELEEEINRTPDDANYTERGWDADTIDLIMDGIIADHKDNIVEYYEKRGITLEDHEIDAFIAIAYGHGNCRANENSINLLRRYKEGNATKEEFINNFELGTGFKPFTYTKWGRLDQLITLFFEGKYILSTGEEIVPGGSIVEAAYAIADYYLNCGVDIWYSNPPRTCIYGNIREAFERPVQEPESYGIVCATFATLAIWKAGLVDEEIINGYRYNNCGGVCQILEDERCADDWEIITNWDELEEGDIVDMEGHTFIYMEGEMCLDQHYVVLSTESPGKDLRGKLLDASSYRGLFHKAYRYVGK